MDKLYKRLKEISQIKEYEINPEIPSKNLLIEVTNRCNCSCIFCANSKMIRKRKNINKDFVKKILIEAYDLGVKEVGFYTTGESLLDPSLSSYIRLAKEIGYEYVYLTTNGILLNEEKAKEIIDAGIDSIKISINAINREDYKFIHGVDYYDVVFDNLKKLYDYRKNKKLSFNIFVSYIATRYTDYAINDIKNHFIDYCDEVAVVNVRNQSGMMPEINKMLSCKKEEGKFESKRLVPCHYVFDTINVTSEGYLTACCTDFENYLAYADLNKISLKEAWNNKTITELRKKHLKNELDGTLCYNCIYDSCVEPMPLSREFVETETLNNAFESNIVIKRLKSNNKML